MKSLNQEQLVPYVIPQKLCNIDLLRGVAAIAILLWHYQHFYYLEAGVNSITGRLSIQPLFNLFSWFYIHGAWAVQFFWILSGFVFFHVYERRRNISLSEFFIHRFARLYPLHLITLCLVALLQFVSWYWFNKFQIYPFNDVWHFILNLFMASHWGFQQGWSFNAPVWSISVEVLVYIMFFVFLKSIGVRTFTSIVWFAWSLLLYKNAQTSIFESAALFALGGVVNQFHNWLAVRNNGSLGLLCSVILAATSLFFIRTGWLEVGAAVQWGIFPALIWIAASLEIKGVSSGALGLGLGNITYSSYLLHVPMQIAIIILLDGIVGNRIIVDSSVFLVAYMLAVVGAALLTYKYIELPLKLYFMNLYGKHLA